MKSLTSKRIIITGGSLGIGLAIAKKCANEGAEVIIAARNKNDLKSALSTIKKISNKNHLTYSLDVGDLNSVNQFAEWINNKGLDINGIVNCAGIYGPIGKIHKVDMNDFSQAIQVNLLGTVYMCNAFSPMLVANENKKIVNFSGGGGASPFPNYSAYASSKAAIIRFTENIALELNDDKFDINCIAPGFVITRLHKKTVRAGSDIAGSGFYENTKKQIEDGGIPPEKAAELCSFLLSEDSDGITGKFISAPWDSWEEKAFQNKLRQDKDFATLRRIDEKFFKKVE
jgi:NAD(P)-dependent dehydrogenase (short-subunit alcohol dehydrogenase family)